MKRIVLVRCCLKISWLIYWVLSKNKLFEFGAVNELDYFDLVLSHYPHSIRCCFWIQVSQFDAVMKYLFLYERICPSGGSIGWIRSRFGVGVRSFLWNRSVRNGGVLGESSLYFREASHRLNTGRKWDWHAPDECWHMTARNNASGVRFPLTSVVHSSLSFDLRLTIVINHE